MDFQEFKKLSLSDIERWKNIKISDEDIQKWKDDGSLVDKLYDLKLKKMYLEYLKIKLQNILSTVDPFYGYDPITEAEAILRKIYND